MASEGREFEPHWGRYIFLGILFYFCAVLDVVDKHTTVLKIFAAL